MRFVIACVYRMERKRTRYARPTRGLAGHFGPRPRTCRLKSPLCKVIFQPMDALACAQQACRSRSHQRVAPTLNVCCRPSQRPRIAILPFGSPKMPTGTFDGGTPGSSMGRSRPSPTTERPVISQSCSTTSERSRRWASGTRRHRFVFGCSPPRRPAPMSHSGPNGSKQPMGVDGGSSLTLA